MCFASTYEPNQNVTGPSYSPADAAEGVTSTESQAGGKTASELDPMATNTSGATNTAAQTQQQLTTATTGLTAGMR